jgi:surfactin synthase thioesterase subunit
MHVFGGKADRNPLPEKLPGWQRVASRDIRIRMFDGDHFFLAPQRAAVLADINSTWPADAAVPAADGRDPAAGVETR